MKNERARIRSSRGFTLAETLMAILILLMVTAIVAAGIPVASNALKKAVEASHAQVLLSTTMTALRDELTTAKNIPDLGGSNDTTIDYTDENGVESKIYLASNGIMLEKEYPSETKSRLLVSQKAATSDLYAEFTDASYDRDAGVLTISGLTVKRGNGSTIADLDDLEFKIKVVG